MTSEEQEEYHKGHDMTNPSEEEVDDDEEEDQRLTDEEMERGLEIYYKENPEQYRALWQGKIKGEDIISKIFVDVKQRGEDIKEEGKAKGLNKKQTDLLYADRTLEELNDELLAVRAVYQRERNYQLTNPPPTNEADRLLAEERLKAAKQAIRSIKKGIKYTAEITRDIEEGKKKVRQKKDRNFL
jgi:hypothetical protein